MNRKHRHLLFKTLDGLQSFLDGHTLLRDSRLKFLVMSKILQELKLKKKNAYDSRDPRQREISHTDKI